MDFANPGNYFELFRIPQSFDVDLKTLEKHYLEILSKVHPDTAVQLTDTERRLTLQWATLTNEAYQTLKRPLERAHYLLRLMGIQTQEDDNTAMPKEFLLEQMEWRETLHQSILLKNETAIENLETHIRNERISLLESLSSLFDDVRKTQDAVVIVRQLSFLEKLSKDVSDALAEME